jgi:mono/diheme cytochrome c family protein
MTFVLLAVLVAGCGGVPGGEVASPTPETIEGPVNLPTTTTTDAIPPEFADGDPVAGKQVFVSKGCGACHVMADAGASGTVGPNLDTSKPALALAVDRIANGKGGMPPFKGQLSDKEIADVAAYVVEASGG